jgi:hypothetical protein
MSKAGNVWGSTICHRMPADACFFADFERGEGGILIMKKRPHVITASVVQHLSNHRLRGQKVSKNASDASAQTYMVRDVSCLFPLELGRFLCDTFKRVERKSRKACCPFPGFGIGYEDLAALSLGSFFICSSVFSP